MHLLLPPTKGHLSNVLAIRVALLEGEDCMPKNAYCGSSDEESSILKDIPFIFTIYTSKV